MWTDTDRTHPNSINTTAYRFLNQDAGIGTEYAEQCLWQVWSGLPSAHDGC